VTHVWQIPGAVEMLECLHAKALSAGRIAERLREHGYPVSRSAVLGRLARMRPPAAMRSAPRWQGPILRQPKRAVFRDVPLEPLDRVPISLLDLTNATCRWPVREDPEASGRHLFCGAPADNAGGRPYCNAHTARALGGK
jgi:hypothetical protein